MIKTAISHSIITVVVSLIAWQLGSLAVGIALSLGFYLGREVAQHERKTPGTNPLRGLCVWDWSIDSALDLAFPAFAAVVLLLILEGLL